MSGCVIEVEILRLIVFEKIFSFGSNENNVNENYREI